MKRNVFKQNGTESFDKMQFNPFALSKGEMMWERYTAFRRRAIYHNPESVQTSDESVFTLSLKQWNEVLRFVVLFVDKQSPFAYEKDFDIRKKLSIEALDIEDKEIITFINNESGHYRKLLFEFFKEIRDHDYRLWFTKLLSIFKYSNFLMVESDVEKDVEKRIKIELEVNRALTVFTEEMKKLEASLFDNQRIKDTIQEEATEEELSGYPERFAKQIEY